MRNVQSIVIYTMCAALLVVSKEMLAFLPNVELVSFLLIMYALHFQLRGCLFISVLFCFLQMILYGVGTWTPVYFIVWPGLVCITKLCKKICTDEYRWAFFSGLFGLSFGFLFSIPYFMMSFETGVAYYVRGIPYDLIHGIANFMIMLILFSKVNQLLGQLSIKYKL